MTRPAALAVVDASLAVKWVLPEEGSDEAEALLFRRFSDGTQPVVPSWFACEVANTLYIFVKAGDLTIEEAQRKVTAVRRMVDVLGDSPIDAVRALAVAHDLQHESTYDAQYIALAERLGCEVWTADDRFRRKVQAKHPRVRALGEA